MWQWVCIIWMNFRAIAFWIIQSAPMWLIKRLTDWRRCPLSCCLQDQNLSRNWWLEIMFQAFWTELAEVCWQSHARKQEFEGKLQSCNTENGKELALEGFLYAVLKNWLPKRYVHVNCIMACFGWRSGWFLFSKNNKQWNSKDLPPTP